jgi:uncharacterized DUF497 family protein
MSFEWDEQKNKTNIRDHKISFEQAISIFRNDRCRVTRWDQRSYDGEDREISIGIIDDGRIITIVHLDRGDNIRIVSARKATKQERVIYHGHCS